MISFLSLALLTLNSISTQNLTPRDGFTLALDSATSFCLIIPLLYGDDIAANDATGISGCWGNPVGAKPSKELPTGMITSAHYVKTNVYTQVTGTYNPAAYGLNPNDQGTQWDNSLLSQGGVMPWSGCAGFPQYLEFFGSNIFCLRCCNYAFSHYCNPSNDTQGCYSAIPGNYGPGFTNANDVALPLAPVTLGLGCAPETDTCASGAVCCVAVGDAAAGNANKTSCQVSNGCVPGSFGNAASVPPAISPSITTIAYTAPAVVATATSPALSASLVAGPTVSPSSVNGENTSLSGNNEFSIANTMMMSFVIVALGSLIL